MKTDIGLNIYAGTVRGGLACTLCKANEKPKYELQEIDQEITALEWGRSDDEILLGHANGAVKIYNTTLAKYVNNITTDLEGEGAVVGLGNIENNIIIGKHNGLINIWSKKVNDTFSLNLEENSTVECFVQHKDRKNIFASGGNMNDYKVWDIETKTSIFKAKSLGHDELNLPFPSTIRGICFFQLEEKLGACATKEGNVLLYDERAQRKHVTKFVEPKASYTCISTAYRDRQCLVGTTKGYMQLIDLRTNKCLKAFKSFTGSVTSIVCDSMSPYVATTSLDRHLRVHSIETKELLYKVYMKMCLTKIIMKPIIKDEPLEEEVAETEIVDQEYEDLFENMETVVEKTPKKRKSKEKVKSGKKLIKKDA